MIKDYWWGKENGKRKMPWISWDMMLRPKCRGGIGFRDMRLFNQALLARQAWRLIQFPNTLCAQLLRAKYYPNGSLLDTVFTGNKSTTWTTIEYGLELFKKGAIWRIGNGVSVRAWRDPWIPRSTVFKPISQQGRCRMRWVSDFIQHDGTWDIQRLRQYFLPIDVDDILKIKPSQRQDTDIIAWQPDKRGIFTVKSAYELAFNEKMMAENVGASSARPDGDRPVWKLIWQCPVPPKVRNLAWRIAKNGIATQVNKRRRGIQTPNTCLICGREDETSFHVFLRCPHAMALWQALADDWDLPAIETVGHPGSEWLLHLLHGVTVTQRGRILMFIWRTWYAHNEVTHNKPLPSVEGSKRFLQSYMDSLILIKQHPRADVEKGKMVVDQNLGMEKEKRSLQGQREKEKWKPPDAGYAKLNVDGSFVTNGGAGAGMVLRNNDGMVIFAAAREFYNCADALDAELAALQEGLNLALQWT